VILLTAIAAGMLTAWAVARWNRVVWHPPEFRSIWLVALGFLPQFLSFYFAPTRRIIPDAVASASLILSQSLLLAFAILNRRLPGMAFLIAGLGMNLIVILANGGFMPLTLEAASRFVDETVLKGLTLGQRIGSASKDILLTETQVVFSWLADRFVPPPFFRYRFAFSLGDVFIAAGAYWLLIDKHAFARLPESGEN